MVIRKSCQKPPPHGGGGMNTAWFELLLRWDLDGDMKCAEVSPTLHRLQLGELLNEPLDPDDAGKGDGDFGVVP